MNKEQAVTYLKFSGFSEEQIRTIEGAFTHEDCISALNRVMEYTYGMLTAEKAGLQHLIKSMLDDLPSVNQQEPCDKCVYSTSEGCQYDDITETIPPFDDLIQRQAVLDTLERMDKALDEDRTVENYKELLRECYKVLPKKSEWEHDHEILKAYSDGASAVLDKIRAEIKSKYESIPDTFHHYETGFTDALEWTLSIIDKYMAEEGSDAELENTMSITYQTPQGRQVKYIKCEVLDKIRAEIEKLAKPNEFGGRGNGKSVRYGLCKALEIIDKYKAEGSEKE